MQQLDVELSGLLAAVTVLSCQDRFDLADLERVTRLYNQAAYLFTYIEGNANYVDPGMSLTIKAALLDDLELRGRLASRVRGLMGERGPVPRRWTEAVGWFLKPPEQVRAEAETRAAMGEVERVLRRIDRDRAALLARLGLGGGPDALMAVPRSVTGPATRSKLLLAWHRVGETHADALAEAMDRLVDQRWRYVTALGYRSVAERGFASCGVSAETVRGFLTAYTGHALRERRVFLSRFEGPEALDDKVRAFCLLARSPDSGRIGGPTAVDLGALLEFIADTVRRAFGITFSVLPGGVGSIESLDVTRGTDALGTLVLDRAVAGTSARVFRFGGDPALPEGPRARVLCLTHRLDGSGETVSFEGARQILHAMGHALVHLAATPRAPSVSGLDILPLERLEGLSHWLEESMADIKFEDSVAVTPEQRDALKAFRQARDDRARNTRLEQVLVATVDLEIHERRGYRVRDAFDARIAAMGGSVGVSFERAVRFMAAPLFRDHPGMGFVYPWGTAFGADRARSATGEQSPVQCLAAYFDPTVAIPVPDAGAEVSFLTPSHSDRPTPTGMHPQ